jgi:DNA-binding response OmpR family regulator
MPETSKQLLERLAACERQLIQTTAEVREMSGLLQKIARGERISFLVPSIAVEDQSALQEAGAMEGEDYFIRDVQAPLLNRDAVRGYSVDQQAIHLTPSETQVLDLLWDAMPQLVSRQQFTEVLYGQELNAGNVSIDVFLSRLRGKLRQAVGRELIRVTRGFGWTLCR